jgi:hypothetical protein
LTLYTDPSTYAIKESVEREIPAATVKMATGSAAARDSGGSGGDEISVDPWEPDGTGAEIREIVIVENDTLCLPLRKTMSTASFSIENNKNRSLF